MKFGLQVRLPHLMLAVASVAVCLWYCTQYQKRRCVAVIERYRLLENVSGHSLQIQFYFKQPANMSNRRFDFEIQDVPITHFPARVKPGTRIEFQYQAKATWLASKEDPLKKFWRTLMINETEAMLDVNEKLSSQILLDFDNR